MPLVLRDRYPLVNHSHEIFSPMRAPVTTLGARVRQARLSARLTQVQLSEMSGLGQSAISSIETGHSHWAQSSNLLRLADALHVDPAWLQTGVAASEPADWQQIIDALTQTNRALLRSIAQSMLEQQR